MLKLGGANISSADAVSSNVSSNLSGSSGVTTVSLDDHRAGESSSRQKQCGC